VRGEAERSIGHRSSSGVCYWPARGQNTDGSCRSSQIERKRATLPSSVEDVLRIFYTAYTFVYHIFIHFNNFSSTLTKFIHSSFNLPTLYNVEKIVWPTVYVVFSVLVLVLDSISCKIHKISMNPPLWTHSLSFKG
jgi:hypothetical protein